MIAPVLKGWIELSGRRLGLPEIAGIVGRRPDEISSFGGEFFLSWGECRARDHFGVVPGDCPKGTVVCRGIGRCTIEPEVPDLPLDEAIAAAVGLRSDEGVTALSGGVDSTLVAFLAKRECVAVGIAGSHDLRRARQVSAALGLDCTEVIISPEAIGDALPQVLSAIPKHDPVNTGIALTQYFIAEWAGDHGFRRILTGQGADELFGGYSRYLGTDTLEADLARDFAGLELQAERDQAVAGLFGCYLSMPYLDLRVVRAARAIPCSARVCGGRRKVPLREVAERYITAEFAWYEKKAMQYGSGVAKELRRLARHNGYKTSVQGYLDQISREHHGQ
ncbi:MAG TPA: asparagine synthase C-terminal domain-containing protein [Methanoregula sp.]|nr:asparagine synthase C-terminal domain-containing protein [Methanoregula sp.]